jgi:hypothetical protein
VPCWRAGVASPSGRATAATVNFSDEEAFALAMRLLLERTAASSLQAMCPALLKIRRASTGAPRELANLCAAWAARPLPAPGPAPDLGLIKGPCRCRLLVLAIRARQSGRENAWRAHGLLTTSALAPHRLGAATPGTTRFSCRSHARAEMLGERFVARGNSDPAAMSARNMPRPLLHARVRFHPEARTAPGGSGGSAWRGPAPARR